MIKGLSYAVTRAMTGCDGRPQRDSVSSPRRAGASPDDPLKHNTDDKARRCAIREDGAVAGVRPFIDRI